MKNGTQMTLIKQICADQHNLRHQRSIDFLNHQNRISKNEIPQAWKITY